MQERINSYDGAGGPPSPPQGLASWYAQGISDGLGDRLLMFDNSGAPSLELLRFHPELADIPGFEAALREQLHRLGRFRHQAFARVRSVRRLEPDDGLALVSNCPPGKRLSEVLHRARGPAFAAALIQQLAPALVLFQRHDTGTAHGILNPDRIVVSPEGRLTIIEQIVGPAIDTLGLETSQLASMGIALPPSLDAASPLGVATDWYQLGLVAVSVLIGRPLNASDLPRLDRLLDGLAYSATADGSGLSPFMRQWLDRALQISGDRIESGEDARAALDELLTKESPRDSRRVESPRREELPPSTPRLADRTSPPGRRPVEAATTAAVKEEESSRLPSHDGPPSRSIEAFPVEQPAVEQPAVQPSKVQPPIVSARATTHPARSSPAQAKALFEQEALAGRNRLLDLVGGSALPGAREADPARPPAERSRSVSTSLVAALVVIAVVEAGVIVWLARAQLFAPVPPLVVETMPTGEHVLVSNGAATAPLQLSVAPDLRWARVASASSAHVLGGKETDTSPGTIQISSPIALKVYEASRLLGSVPGTGLRLAAGRHQLELVNAALGFRLEQTIEVEAGQSVSIHVAPPHGQVTIDASPWAEVTIDGQPVGRTPLGPLPLALGEHVITFRHPAGSKDQQKVMVKSDTTTRVVGNLRF